MDRKLKNIYFSLKDLPGMADSVIFLSFECTINPQNFVKIVQAVYQKTKILNFFLMWTTLNFEGRSKKKKETGNIGKGTLIWTRLVSWFRRYVTWDSKLKTIFIVSRIFPGKADSVILLGVECAINPQNC